MGTLRDHRREVLDALTLPDRDQAFARLSAHPARRLLGPLCACLLESEALVRWRAAEALGQTMARLAEADREKARDFARQLLWRLNEESGNVAWGAPEALGAALALEPGLGREFHRVLCSYIHEADRKTGDNYLELPLLRRGVHWGLARLATAVPELALPALPDLLGALTEHDPATRALAALTLGRLAPLAGDRREEVAQALERLAGDQARAELYIEGRLCTLSVAQSASLALAGQGV